MLGKPLVRFCEGSGINSGHGRDIVAPPVNQAENGENKRRPTAWGVLGLLEKSAKIHEMQVRSCLFSCISRIS